ncbi:hypothetical protein ACFE04_012505 [Oxalis oulophora]
MSRYSNIEVGIFPVFSGLEYDKFVQASETLKWKYDIYKHHGSSLVVRTYNIFVDKEHIVETHDFNASLVEFVEDVSPEVVTLYNKHRSEFVYNFFDTRIKTDKLGRVAKYGKSEQIPQESDELVEVIVSDNFDEKVMKSRKNGVCAYLSYKFEDMV